MPTSEALPRWLPAMVALGVLVVCFGLWQAVVDEERVLEGQAVEVASAQLRRVMEERTRLSVSSVERVARGRQQLEATGDVAWSGDATRTALDDPSLVGLRWSDASGAARWVGPESAAAAFGALDAARREAALQKARLLGRTTISRTIEIPGGHRGVLVVAPITRGGDLHGFVEGLMDADLLLAAVAASIDDAGFELVVYHGDSRLMSTLEGTIDPGASAPAVLVRVGDAVWHAVLAEGSGRHKTGRGTARAVLLALLLLGLAIATTVHLLRSAGLRESEAREANRVLAEQIRERQRAERELLRLTTTLEERVQERTRDLEESRVTALAMMEGAREARNEAQRAQRELEARAEELARINAELEQFAYVASHDLQEPLRMVASYCQLLERRYAEVLDDRARRYVDYAVEGASRMQRLIDDLLALSRVGRTEESWGPVEVEAVMRDVLADQRQSLSVIGAAVDIGELPQVFGSRVLVEQILRNLVSNALKFSRQGVAPRVQVRAERSDHRWVLSVHDNGIGMNLEHAQRIFHAFQRIHSRGSYSGSGIGLAIVKKAVTFHGGEVWVESVEGEGSTFYFTLPAGSLPTERVDGQAGDIEGAIG